MLNELSNQMADAVAAAAPSVVQVQGRRRPASGIVYSDSVVHGHGWRAAVSLMRVVLVGGERDRGRLHPDLAAASSAPPTALTRFGAPCAGD